VDNHLAKGYSKKIRLEKSLAKNMKDKSIYLRYDFNKIFAKVIEFVPSEAMAFEKFDKHLDYLELYNIVDSDKSDLTRGELKFHADDENSLKIIFEMVNQIYLETKR